MTTEKQTPTKRKVGDGTPGPGRKRGVPNRTTTLLKDAILAAATAVGEDGQGKNGLVGYLTGLAKRNDKAFAPLLGKVLPMQVTGEGGGPVTLVLQGGDVHG